MISKAILQKAVEQKILQQNQLEPLYTFIQQQDRRAVSGVEAENQSASREEPLRFIRSFGDVFITLGILLLVVAISKIGLSGYSYLLPVAAFVVLAEWLVRARRLVLPGMAILISILYFVDQATGFHYEEGAEFDLAILCITSLVFYLRYRMPFSLLPLAAGIVAIIILQVGLDVLNQPIIFAVLGLGVLVVALWLDAQDTARSSHLSDSAFWLHLLAAPLIVHGVMVSTLLSDHDWVRAYNAEVFIIVFFVVFFLFALLIDRRAILVSTQLYVIYALTQVFQGAEMSGQDVVIYVLIALGLFVIYFGTYWYRTRRLIFGFLSGGVLSRYIPDVRLKDAPR